MKKLAILLLVLFTFSCAGFSPKQDYNLEVRMEVLEKELKRIELMAAAGEAAAVDRAWPFYGLVGGGNALDGITEASIGDNDFAIGRDSSGYGYLYYWDATDGNGESSPGIIKPNDGDGTGSWLSIDRWYAESFYSTAADGDHYIDPSNSSAFPTGMAEGSITCRDDRDACFVYDGSNWWPLLTGKYGAYASTGTISTVYCWGGVVTNNGAAGNIVLTLPSAVQGMLVRISRVDGSGSITVQEGSGDAIDGTSDIVLDADLESVTLYAISVDTWAVVGDSGTPTYN